MSLPKIILDPQKEITFSSKTILSKIRKLICLSLLQILLEFLEPQLMDGAQGDFMSNILMELRSDIAMVKTLQDGSLSIQIPLITTKNIIKALL